MPTSSHGSILAHALLQVGKTTLGCTCSARLGIGIGLGLGTGTRAARALAPLRPSPHIFRPGPHNLPLQDAPLGSCTTEMCE